MKPPAISAFVICHNSAETIGTCLRGLHFADELIVIDKASTDASPAIARGHADKMLTVPWTPTVEETRALALSLCQHDWILFLDADECLTAEAATHIKTELENPQADIYEFPLRHYILGQHDERAYYWPEHHVRLFRRGAITFSPVVHAGIQRHSVHQMKLPVSKGTCIHHLSNATVAGWVEKTNRYTANPNRAGARAEQEGLAAFAHRRIDYWFAQNNEKTARDYPAAVALLRSVYDLVDALKAWEEENGADGANMLRQACQRLNQEYARNSAA